MIKEDRQVIDKKDHADRRFMKDTQAEAAKGNISSV